MRLLSSSQVCFFLPMSCLVGGCWNVIGGDLQPESRDFYVDPSGVSGSYRSIGEALSAAKASAASNRTIHLAEGTYDAHSGERFPLEIRGISLVGAGTDKTILRGSGPAPVARPDSSIEAAVEAALLVGDVGKDSTTIAELSIRSTEPDGAAGTEAIVCDRGDTANDAPVSPNLLISGVSIEGFEIGLRVTSAPTVESGCSALVRASSFERGSYGVFADGAIGDGISVSARFVSVQVGDGTSEGGNSFRNLGVGSYRGPLSYFAGAGVATRRAVTAVTIRGNQFTDSDQGVFAYASMPSGARGFVITDNEFGRLGNAGVQLFGYTRVDGLENNSFHDISTPDGRSDIDYRGVALILDSYDTDGFPQVRRARNNSIVGNDQGIILRSSRVLQASDLQSDFGTMADPGLNTFRCNAVGRRVVPRPGVGGDVVLAVSAALGTTLPFVGNEWDHSPPTVSFSMPTSEGIDVSTSGPNINVDGAVKGLSECPADRIGGPAD